MTIFENIIHSLKTFIMNKKFYTTIILSALMLISFNSMFAQQSGGSIVLTNFGDSTYTTGAAGEFNYTEFEVGQTINIKGMYGDVATATEANVNYTIFATDWSAVAYDTVEVFASTAMGGLNGVIDVDFTIPMDADTFGVHDILDPDTDTLITPAPTFIQVRIFHGDPPPTGLDVFWYEFVRVRGEGSLASSVNNFEKLEGLEIFPNPASEEVTINTLEDGEATVMVYDITGKRVMVTNLTSNRLDVSSLQTGFHLIRVEQNEKIGIVRLMIK